MDDCQQVKIPMGQNLPRVLEDDCIVGQKPYKELAGCLMYLMLNTRPDISSAIFTVITKAMLLKHNGNSKKPLISQADAYRVNDYDRKYISGFLIWVY
jgi:hypothetical protein